MVYLGTSITAGNRASVDSSEANERNGSNGHSNENNIRSSTDQRDHDSSGDEEREGQIRVGKDYQSTIPTWIPPERKCFNGH